MAEDLEEDDLHNDPSDEPEGEEDEVTEAEDVEEDDTKQEESDAEEEDTVAGAAGKGDEEPAPQSRAAARISKLNRELREEQARRIKAETLAEERARGAAPQNGGTEEARRAREEKLALMDPIEKREFLNQEKLADMEFKVQVSELRTADMLDKNSYQMQAASNPLYAKHQADVEARLASERRAGRNWTRQDILEKIIGEKALKTKPDAKQKDAAARRVNSSKANSVSARSNVSKPSRNRGDDSLEDLEARLENVHF
jgi:hypothetical protein